MEEALEAASLHPAQVLGISHRKGKLDYGSDAGQHPSPLPEQTGTNSAGLAVESFTAAPPVAFRLAEKWPSEFQFMSCCVNANVSEDANPGSVVYKT